MCRLVGYLGKSILLNELLYTPEHSLHYQSYQPKELKADKKVCADGVGIGWYDGAGEAYVYREMLPIWNDSNLQELSRYVQSDCAVGYVRLAGGGEPLNRSNCQPFRHQELLFVHNGEISNFQKTLFRPLRSSFSDETYQQIEGTTDSEHIFALLVEQRRLSPEMTLIEALSETLKTLTHWATKFDLSFSANLIVSDGRSLVASRYAYQMDAPSLYWTCDDVNYPTYLTVASEPLDDQKWLPFTPQSTLFVTGMDSLQPSIRIFESEEFY